MYLHHRRLHFNPDDPHQYPEASESFEHYLVNTKHWHSACELLAGCDYIASFENFEEEWVAILRKLGMGPPEKGIPKKNAAIERYDYRTFYNDLTAAVVGKRWADDVELGPYSF